MAAAIVFRGQRASAEVVAGFLRTSGIHLVEVIPPTPYPAGPLSLAFVRVLDDQGERATGLLADQAAEAPTPRTDFVLWQRFMAEFLLLIYIAVVPG